MFGCMTAYRRSSYLTAVAVLGCLAPTVILLLIIAVRAASNMHFLMNYVTPRRSKLHGDNCIVPLSFCRGFHALSRLPRPIAGGSVLSRACSIVVSRGSLVPLSTVPCKGAFCVDLNNHFPIESKLNRQQRSRQNQKEHHKRQRFAPWLAAGWLIASAAASTSCGAMHGRFSHMRGGKVEHQFLTPRRTRKGSRSASSPSSEGADAAWSSVGVLAPYAGGLR